MVTVPEENKQSKIKLFYLYVLTQVFLIFMLYIHGSLKIIPPRKIQSSQYIWSLKEKNTNFNEIKYFEKMQYIPAIIVK